MDKLFLFNSWWVFCSWICWMRRVGVRLVNVLIFWKSCIWFRCSFWVSVFMVRFLLFILVEIRFVICFMKLLVVWFFVCIVKLFDLYFFCRCCCRVNRCFIVSSSFCWWNGLVRYILVFVCRFLIWFLGVFFLVRRISGIWLVFLLLWMCLLSLRLELFGIIILFIIIFGNFER